MMIGGDEHRPDLISGKQADADDGVVKKRESGVAPRETGGEGIGRETWDHPLNLLGGIILNVDLSETAADQL